MNRKQRIFDKITKELNPEFLRVNNNSHLHKGHLGDDGSDETHFLIEIKSQKLSEMTRIKAHQEINRIVKDEFAQGLHALEIKINR